MATLRAHGSKLAQVERYAYLQGSGTPYRETLALMSDGKILKKVDFRGEYPHSTGWKQYAKLKVEPTPDAVTRWLDTYKARNWQGERFANPGY